MVSKSGWTNNVLCASVFVFEVNGRRTTAFESVYLSALSWEPHTGYSTEATGPTSTVLLRLAASGGKSSLLAVSIRTTRSPCIRQFTRFLCRHEYIYESTHVKNVMHCAVNTMPFITLTVSPQVSIPHLFSPQKKEKAKFSSA